MTKTKSLSWTGRGLRSLIAVGMLAATAVVSGAVPPFGVPAASAALGAGGEYHPVTPARVLDTRQPTSSPTGARGFGAANAFDVQIVGATSISGAPSGIPASDVLAVVATITVAGTNRSGYLSAYPSGTALPNASNLNFKAGQDASNLAVLRPGANGKISIDLETDGSAPAAGGTTQVLIDVLGWFSTSTSGVRGARLISLAPARVLDTRTGVGHAGSLGAGEQIDLTIRGIDSANPPHTDYVPNDPNVTGVILNVTATGPTQTTFISLQPDAFTGFPSTSTVNLLANQTKANLVMVPVDASGKVRIYNASGNVQVLADVVGYFVNGVNDESRTGRIVPISSPFRALDTRVGTTARRLGAGQAEPWDFTGFVQSVKLGGVPVGDVDSLLMNLTVADLYFPYDVPRKDTFLTVYPGPDGSPRPDASALNVINKDQGAVPNFDVARLSTNNVLNVYNDNGFVNYLADVAAVVLR